MPEVSTPGAGAASLNPLGTTPPSPLLQDAEALSTPRRRSPGTEERSEFHGRTCAVCRSDSSTSALMRVCHCVRYVHEQCQETRAFASPCTVCGEPLQLRPSHRYSAPQAVLAWVVGHLLQATASVLATLVLLLVAVWCELYVSQSARNYQEVKQLRASDRSWAHLVRDPVLVTWPYVGAILLLSASVLAVGAIVGINVRLFIQWWWSIA